MTMSNKTIRAFQERWLSICEAGGALDFTMAEFAHDLAQETKGYTPFAKFYLRALDCPHTAKIAMFWRMSEAFKAVSSGATWKAIGWEGVRDLSRIADAKARKSVESQVVGRCVGPAALRSILARAAPGLFTVVDNKRRGGRGGKGGGVRGSTKSTGPWQVTMTKLSPAGERVAFPAVRDEPAPLASAFVRLVKEGVLSMQMLKPHLTAKEVKELERLVKSKAKAQA